MTITKLGLCGLFVVTTLCPAADQQQSGKQRPHKHVVVVRGRCVDEGGQPLAGCQVSFTGAVSRRSNQAANRKPPAPQTTGKDGRFEFRFLPPRSSGHRLAIVAKGRFSRHARWSAFTPGQVEDLRDIWVPVGSTVTGRVLNRDGKPMRHVKVVVQDLPAAIGAGRREKAPALFQSGPDNRQFHRYGSVGAWTKADGTFRFESPIPPGEWPVRVTTTGLTQVGAARVVVPERGRPAHVKIVVYEEPFVAGNVVDEHGKPVAGVQLMLRVGRRQVWTRSRQDGWFRCYRPGGALPELVLRVTDSADCDPSSLSMPCTWGKHDLQVKLRRSLAFEMTVVDDSGKPIEEFSVKCYGLGQRFLGSRTRGRLHGAHPQGRVTVDRVPRGWNRLVVIPADVSLGIAEIRFEAKDGDPGPRRVEIPRLVPMKVHVRDQQGKPVPHARVQVIDPGDLMIKLDSRVEDHRGWGTWGTDPRGRMPAKVLSSALTNAGGHCIVHGVLGAANFMIRVSIGKRHLYLERNVEFGADHLTRKIELDG